MSNMSLYIPRVFNNIDEARVANVFEKLGFGKISKVDFVSKEKYKSAYVHFASWNDNDATRAFRKELEENGKAKINYDDPWFWIVLEYKKKHVSTPENSMISSVNVPPTPKKQKALMRGVARRLNFDEEHVTTNLVDASYVRYLEQQNAYLYSVIQQQKNMMLGPNQHYTWA